MTVCWISIVGLKLCNKTTNHRRPLQSELQNVVQTTTSEVCLRHGELFETFQSLSFSNFYVPSCRAWVCTTFCMNEAVGREFLGLHPFFTVKNGWKIKQKFLFLKPKSLFTCYFLSLWVACAYHKGILIRTARASPTTQAREKSIM